MADVLPFRRRSGVLKRLTQYAIGEVIDGKILVRFDRKFGGARIELSVDVAESFANGLLTLVKSARDGSGQ